MVVPKVVEIFGRKVTFSPEEVAKFSFYGMEITPSFLSVMVLADDKEDLFKTESDEVVHKACIDAMNAWIRDTKIALDLARRDGEI